MGRFPWQSCFSRAIWREARFCAALILARSFFVMTPSDFAPSSILLTCSCCLFSQFASRSFSCPSSAKTAADAARHVPEQGEAPKVGPHDSEPGPAWKTVGGTVKRVEGGIYTVEDYEGNQVNVHVGQGTKHINKKKVGDTVRAEITRGGFANSIQ